MSGNQPGGFLIVFPFGEFPNTWYLAEKTGWPRESAFLKEANPLGPHEANMLIKSAVAAGPKWTPWAVTIGIWHARACTLHNLQLRFQLPRTGVSGSKGLHVHQLTCLIKVERPPRGTRTNVHHNPMPRPN